jgi:hypothetical protein
MSDQPPATPAPGEPERPRPERQSAAERRGQETVILSSNNLSEMMAQAKAEPAGAEPGAAADPLGPAVQPALAPASAPVADDADRSSGSRRLLAIIIGVILVAIVVIGILLVIAKK